MEAERRRILYSGTVQGVGFRWMAVRALEGLSVTGFVRNLVDGRVELVIEAAPAAADEAAARIRSTLGSYIRAEEAETLPATGEFREFGIRR
jgi:acylphosphatase